VGHRQGGHFSRNFIGRNIFASAAAPPHAAPPHKFVFMQCVTRCNSKKAEDQAKLALEISVIGALMQKANDTIQEPKRTPPSERSQAK
jgi:hypothetical protein